MYPFLFAVLKAEHEFDHFVVMIANPEDAFRRNVHGVPLEMCRVMASRLKGLAVPSWWSIAYAPDPVGNRKVTEQ
jgi:hypothetical protein